MNRAVVSVALLAAVGPALLWWAPTAPPRVPLPSAAAVPCGLLAGVALFAGLARARPRVLLTPLAIVTALVVAGVGVSEEAVWRAFALGRLAPLAGVWVAVGITSAGFAATHLPALRIRGAAVQLATGAAFGVLFVVSGSLLACALAHATYNVLAVLGRRARPCSAAFSFRGVEKRFRERVVLDAVDLTVERGELVALLGPNGAGKTTLASLLLGLRRPSAGEVRVFGGDPRHWRAREHVGATPQEMGFPPTLRAREVLELARAHAPSAPPVARVADDFGLANDLHRQTGALSGGQRRRLALAVAFAAAPKLVVLDEPTTGLDVESRRHAWDAISRFAAEGGTVLLATHNLDEAEALAKRIVVLANGTVVADGSSEHLKACAGPDLEDAFLRLTRA